MDSQPLRFPSADPHLAMLARVSGRTLLSVFLVVVVTSVVPFAPRSLDWGVQFSTRVIEFTSFAFVGVAFLRFASFLSGSPDPAEDPEGAMQLARQRSGALRLCQLGVISLVLLSIWQVVLFFGTLSLLDQQNAALSAQLGQRLSQVEQSLQQAPEAVVQQQWQRLVAAKAPGLNPALSDPQQQRKALQEALGREEKQANLNVIKQGGEKRFNLVVTTIRRLALSVAFSAGFHALSRRIRW